jgi:hypothetical protein
MKSHNPELCKRRELSVGSGREDSEQTCKFKITTKTTLDDTSNATWLNIHQYLVAVLTMKVNGAGILLPNFELVRCKKVKVQAKKEIDYLQLSLFHRSATVSYQPIVDNQAHNYFLLTTTFLVPLLSNSRSLPRSLSIDTTFND